MNPYLRAYVKQATIYTAIVLFVIMCFTVFLFSFIIPKFSALLGSLKIEQPFLTKVVFGVEISPKTPGTIGSREFSWYSLASHS